MCFGQPGLWKTSVSSEGVGTLVLLRALLVAARAGFRAPMGVSGRPWQGCAHAG